jgi:hypothetical protein
MTASTLTLFRRYGAPPDDSAFDFIPIETIAANRNDAAGIPRVAGRLEGKRTRLSGKVKVCFLLKLVFEALTPECAVSGGSHA